MRVIVFANGEIQNPKEILGFVDEMDILIAANGGARHCLSLALFPKLIIGDHDSLTEAEIQTLEQGGAELQQHPANKDETDLELALFKAKEFNPEEIIIFGALGARWDMSVANLLLLAHPGLKLTPIRIIDGFDELSVLQSDQVKEIFAQPGDTISLIPLCGDAKGISTHGLEYPLEKGTLRFGATRGVSNVISENQAWITLEEGLLLVVIIKDH
ncbi:MAG: thiamine diphosphokinase [Anaerolineales bacterium]|nr:thiamine diphosphokinase [Anaerolineales bacterium]